MIFSNFFCYSLIVFEDDISIYTISSCVIRVVTMLNSGKQALRRVLKSKTKIKKLQLKRSQKSADFHDFFDFFCFSWIILKTIFQHIASIGVLFE